MTDQPELLSIDEVANLLKVGVPTVESLINRGMLTARQQGGQAAVPYAEVLAFLRQDQARLANEEPLSGDLGLISGGDQQA